MNLERIAEIRSLSSETKDKAILLRCEAVIRWLEDTPKNVVAEELECCWTFVKKWVDKWKVHGAQSLFQKSWRGRTPIIPYETRGELRTKILVFFQIHPEKTVSDLKDFLETQGFKIGLSSTYNLLDDLGISYQKPRPFNPKQDKNEMEEFKKKIQEEIDQVQKAHPAKKVEVWFEDESRYGQQGIVPRFWATRGSSPSLPKQNGFKNAWLFGAVCPQTGEHIGLVATHTNTEFMNIFLENLSKALDSDVHGVLIMDNASWHKSLDLKVPSNLTLKYQPPYCPELNPVERLWKYIKSKHLSHKFYVSLAEIFEEGCNAFKKLTKETIKTLCRVNYLSV